MDFYGDEIAMPGGNDPDDRRDFPAVAFDNSGTSPEQQNVRAHVRRLARLRARLEPLRRGKMVNLYADDNVYAYERTGGGTAVIILNNAAKAVTVAFEVPGLERASGWEPAPQKRLFSGERLAHLAGASTSTLAGGGDREMRGARTRASALPRAQRLTG